MNRSTIQRIFARALPARRAGGRRRAWARALTVIGLVAAASALPVRAQEGEELDFLFSDPGAKKAAPAEEASRPAPREERVPASSENAATAAPLEDASPPPPGPALSEPPPPALPASPPPAVVQPRKRVIEEVVVTAQKTEQRLDDVPISVNVLSGEQLREAGIFELKSLENYIPLVRVEPEIGGTIFTLRGFGTFGSGEFENSVGLVVDDVALSRPPFILNAFFDLDRIEVLRGPQGTLFGKNSPAGVFHIVSAGPTEELSGTAGAYLGNLGERRVHAAIGGPIFDTLGFRLAFLHEELDEFVFNTKLLREEDAGSTDVGRVKLRWTPLPALELEASALGSRVDRDTWAIQLDELEPATRDYLDDFDPRVEGNPVNFQNSMDFPGSLRLDTHVLSGRAIYDLGDLWRLSDLELTLVLARAGYGGLLEDDLDISPADLTEIAADRFYDQDTIELRMAGTAPTPFGWGDALRFVVGTYVYRGRNGGHVVFFGGDDIPSFLATEDALELSTGQDETTPPGPGVRDQVAQAFGIDPNVIDQSQSDEDKLDLILDQNIDLEAIFGQATWELTHRLWLTAGARLNQERRKAFFLNTSEGVLLPALLQYENFERRIRRSENDVSPKASLQYHWTDDITTFFTWAKGFKSGGFNLFAFNDPDNTLEFEPESSNSYEIGVKARLFDDTLQWNAAIFRTTFEDLQVQVFDGTRFFVFNAERATSQGVESDFRWLTPFEPLQVTGSVGWIDAAYGEGARGPAPVFSSERITDLEGSPLQAAPKITAGLSPSLYLPSVLAPLGLSEWTRRLDLVTTIDVLYTGDQFLDVDADPDVFQSSYVQTNARFGFVAPDGSWSALFAGKNLTGERFRTLSNDALYFPGTYTTRQGKDRQFGLDLTYHW